ncbi:MAG: anhydro-N-acetylmuramic acid kinase [Planctomycetota bacterium]
MSAHDDDDARVLVGLMSGTSGDGIDAAAVLIRGGDDGDGGGGGDHGRVRSEVLAHHHAPFDDAFRREVLAIPDARPGTLARMHRVLGERFAAAARAAMDLAELAPARVAAVVSPGLTAAHEPPEGDDPGATLTLGDADVIAAGTGCAVISDLRASDRAAGGHGAPLVPFADALLLRRPDAAIAALNLGGIANVTVVPPDGDPVAFDTGPGNMAIDGALLRVTEGRLGLDENGALGKAGRVDRDWLAQLIAEDAFLDAPPPRSTGRERYGEALLTRHAAKLAVTTPADLAATLAAYTVHAVTDALTRWVPWRPLVLVVSGGGAYNRCLMEGLSRALPDMDVTDSERALGIPVLAKEAVAFALLGDATLRGIPSNVPSVTGAQRPCVLGRISPAP